MNVRYAGPRDIEAWNKLASDCSASIFHSYGWGEVLVHAFGYKRLYLLAESDGEVSGILPLFYLKGLFAGRRLVSLPVSDLGGPLGSSESVSEILESCQQLMLDLSGDYVEVKGAVSEDDYVLGKSFPSFMLDLPGNSDVLWDIVGKKNRNLVRKADKEGLQVEEVNSFKGVNDFYEVYAKTMKQLGTPPYPKSFYECMHRILGKNKECSIMLARKDGEVMGGAIFLSFNDYVYYLAGVSPLEYRNYSPNTFLVYKGLEKAVKDGFKKFDFGRTSTQGVYNFKKSWGGSEKKLSYYYKLLNPQKKIGGNKIQTLSPLWRSIVPLSLTKIIGPQIRRNFGF